MKDLESTSLLTKLSRENTALRDRVERMKKTIAESEQYGRAMKAILHKKRLAFQDALDTITQLRLDIASMNVSRRETRSRILSPSEIDRLHDALCDQIREGLDYYIGSGEYGNVDFGCIADYCIIEILEKLAMTQEERDDGRSQRSQEAE